MAQMSQIRSGRRNNVVAFRILPDPMPFEVPALSPVGVGVMLISCATALWLYRRTPARP